MDGTPLSPVRIIISISNEFTGKPAKLAAAIFGGKTVEIDG
jgi:hypothetical protein